MQCKSSVLKYVANDGIAKSNDVKGVEAILCIVQSVVLQKKNTVLCIILLWMT